MMLSAVFSLYSTMLDFLAAAPENSVGFSDKIKHTQATDIKFGDTFRTISPVFSERLLNQVNQEIDDDNIYFRSDFVKGFLEGREVSSDSIDIKTSKIFDRLELHNNSENPMFLAKLCPGKPTIQFDKNGHLMNKEGFQKTFLTTSSDALRTLCSDALEKMADEFQWRGRSVKVRNISLMRYPLIPSRGMKGMPWHQDYGKKSMVVQLNDNTNAAGTGVKYSGGGINIGKKSYSDFLGTFPVKGTVEKYPYGKNGGVIFSNQYYLIHQAEDIIVCLGENNDDLAEKRIILVFVDDSE